MICTTFNSMTKDRYYVDMRKEKRTKKRKNNKKIRENEKFSCYLDKPPFFKGGSMKVIETRELHYSPNFSLGCYGKYKVYLYSYLFFNTIQRKAIRSKSTFSFLSVHFKITFFV